MFTPDMLNLWGNTLGHLGVWAFLALAVGVGVLLSIVCGFRRAFELDSHSYGDLYILSRIGGGFLARLILACGKIPLTVSISTGLLVSAGFVFNEVFIYWFPNFAFAYLLLGLVAIINLAGRKAVAVCQVGAVAVVLAGMLSLLIRAFWGSGTVDPHMAVSTPAYLFTGVVVLMGFDIALYGRLGKTTVKQIPWSVIFGVIFIGGGVLAAWGWIALRTVPSSKLADSTISHMVIARTIWGQTGRYIMGCIVIAAVFAAVNGLMYCASHVLARVIKPLAPGNDIASEKRHFDDAHCRGAKPMVVVLCLVTLLAMAGGWAGEPILKTMIQAGVIYWLAHYGVVSFGYRRQLRLAKVPRGDHLNPISGLIPWVATLGITAAIIGVVALAPAPETLGILLAVIPLVMGGVLLLLGVARQLFYQRGR